MEPPFPTSPRSATEGRKDTHTKVWLFDKYIGIAFVDNNHDGEDGKGPLPKEDSWEEHEIFDAIWLNSKGWGTNTKLFNTTNREEDQQQYVINSALHTMVWVSANN